VIFKKKDILPSLGVVNSSSGEIASLSAEIDGVVVPKKVKI